MRDARLAEWIFERDSGGRGHVTFHDFVDTYHRGKNKSSLSTADSAVRARAAFDARASLHDGLVQHADVAHIVEQYGFSTPTVQRDIDAWLAARGLSDARISFELFCELIASLTGDRNVHEEKE